MNTAFILNFSESDVNNIGELLSKRGINLISVENNAIERLTDSGKDALVFINVNSREDIRFLKRLRTEAPDVLYAVGLPIDEREIIFNVLLIDSIVPFFLPLEKDEFLKVLNRILENARYRDAESSVFSGLKESKMEFEWKTKDIAVSSVCRYLAGWLRKAGIYSNTTEEENAVLALEEALVNSIEHGNLELDSSLRPKDLLEEDKYELLKEKRLRDDIYSKRRIFISLKMDRKGASLSIKDEGPGFDTSSVKEFLETESLDRDKVMDVSGKGFTLIKRAFDSINYNEDGTVITLVKKRT